MSQEEYQNLKTEIIDLHNTMYDYTLEAGVDKKKYYSVIAELEQFSLREMAELRDWLLKIRKKEYAEVNICMNYLPREIWERYKLLGVTGMREQKVLESAQKGLRKIWDKPYRTQFQLERIKQKKAAVPNKPESNEKGVT